MQQPDFEQDFIEGFLQATNRITDLILSGHRGNKNEEDDQFCGFCGLVECEPECPVGAAIQIASLAYWKGQADAAVQN